MSPPPAAPVSDTAQRAATLIAGGFDDYNARFSDITRRARRRFERRDWKHAQTDATARIDLYEQCVRETLSGLEALLEERVRSRPLWRAILPAYAARIATRPDRELYKTFYNSLVRRFFQIDGVAPDVEFLALEIVPTGDPACPGELRHHAFGEEAVEVWCAIFRALAYGNGWADLEASAGAVAEALRSRGVIGVSMLRTPFYRERRAYLVGRAHGASGATYPVVVALVSDVAGVRADAVIVDDQQISILFGFSRSHFHADLARVGDVVAFLHQLLPRKPLDELFTVVGRIKQGKTERYRQVFRHLAEHPDEELVLADGERGMVMAVFTPRGYPVVFKLIRDRFAYPKDMVRAEVEEKYRLVFRRDRIGRLVDAQEFLRLRFPKRQFAPAALQELLSECAQTVQLDGDEVLIRHCYVERRVRPLNLYVREAAAPAAERAVLDYGQAIKDLARSNIFPGDLLLKNFGVSRHGRVLFYDYDELCLVEECRFRAVPAMREEDETRPLDEWLYAGADDVFPELFPQFLGIAPALRARLRAVHGEIFDPAWWRDVQGRLAAGEHFDVPPYPDAVRLPFC
ncbi:bifunctional isocitrate dehydrogenase kinase/phosphatase [Lysobacter hankyongensis]|uniref:Isocitrate dehydrogenase kinase/phosphatase n=1 Tax=Lysobacter hankyongensis TaxID=1176535 RepID=A0ABP9B1L6_9GAMM